MRKIVIVCLWGLLLQSCDFEKRKSLAGRSPAMVAEAIVESVFVQDTDSLKTAAEPVHSNKYWKQFEVHALLPENPVYKRLDSIEEIFSPIEPSKANHSVRRSNAVDHYISSRDLFKGKMQYSVKNLKELSNCRAYIKHDTIIIQIGMNTGFGGNGFHILVHDGRYVIMPFYFTDIVYGEEVEPLNVPLWQRLKLNRSFYNAGDSMYGYISFGSVFYDEYGTPSGQKANGFFRAVIKKACW
ncbi:hypothetical protein [Niabella ginsenosidivorans]|nr:hypothetical protein [Niabella ginsenosidivorans]